MEWLKNKQRCRGSRAVIATIAAIAALGSVAQAETTLRWKFKAGDSTNYEIKMLVVQESKVGDMPVAMKMDQLMNMTWEVKEVSDDGSAVLNQVINRVQLEMAVPQAGGAQSSLKYDSASPEKAPGTEVLARTFEAMIGKPFVMKVSPLGKISDFKAPAEMLAALKNSPLQQSGGMFSEDGLKQMMSQSMMNLPEEAINKGKTWDTTAEVKMPLLGKQITNTEYKYEGEVEHDGKQLEKLGISLDMKIEAAPDAQAQVKLKSHEGIGDIFWDNVNGRPVESNMRSKMTLEISVGTMSIEQNVTTTVQMKQVPPTGAREL